MKHNCVDVLRSQDAEVTFTRGTLCDLTDTNLTAIRLQQNNKVTDTQVSEGRVSHTHTR